MPRTAVSHNCPLCVCVCVCVCVYVRTPVSHSAILAGWKMTAAPRRTKDWHTGRGRRWVWTRTGISAPGIVRPRQLRSTARRHGKLDGRTTSVRSGACPAHVRSPLDTPCQRQPRQSTMHWPRSESWMKRRTPIGRYRTAPLSHPQLRGTRSFVTMSPG